MSRRTLKSLSSFFLLLGLLTTSLEVLAVTLLNSSPPPSIYNASAAGGSCTKQLTERIQPQGQYAYDFNGYNLTSYKSGTVNGVMCAGKYQVYTNCFVNIGGGCSGSSCGWGVQIYGTAVSGGGVTVATNNSSSHDNCSTSHSNPCENQSIHMWTTGATYDTSKTYNLYPGQFLESGTTIECVMSAQYIGAVGS
jgi:hypothetical protein